VPVALLGRVDRVSVVEPDPVTDDGENDELTRAGNPEATLNVTAEKGPSAVTVTVKVVFEPRFTV
jgi:hypothetical protein